MNEIIQLDSIDAYNRLYGLPTLHPLVTVVDLTKATRVVNHVKMNYGVYALFLKGGVNCTLKYGCKYYDYHSGTIVSFAPGQLIGVDSDEDEVRPEVYGLMFHPDLIYGTSLGHNMDKYTFFSYSQTEALHLSDSEREIILDCLKKIQMELEHPVDKHSKELLAVNIELMLDYCLRFYDRQFITREKVNNDILVRFGQYLDDYFRNGDVQRYGLPMVKYFADKVCLSPGYFGDLVRKETGKSAQEYIRNRLIDMAKEKILGTSQDISQIAYSLGFQYPQHFNRFFKRCMGCTPSEFRTKNS